MQVVKYSSNLTRARRAHCDVLNYVHLQCNAWTGLLVVVDRISRSDEHMTRLAADRLVRLRGQ
jgi:hypothetical protein